MDNLFNFKVSDDIIKYINTIESNNGFIKSQGRSPWVKVTNPKTNNYINLKPYTLNSQGRLDHPVITNMSIDYEEEYNSVKKTNLSITCFDEEQLKWLVNNFINFKDDITIEYGWSNYLYKNGICENETILASLVEYSWDFDMIYKVFNVSVSFKSAGFSDLFNILDGLDLSTTSLNYNFTNEADIMLKYPAYFCSVNNENKKSYYLKLGKVLDDINASLKANGSKSQILIYKKPSYIKNHEYLVTSNNNITLFNHKSQKGNLLHNPKDKHVSFSNPTGGSYYIGDILINLEFLKDIRSSTKTIKGFITRIINEINSSFWDWTNINLISIDSYTFTLVDFNYAYYNNNNVTEFDVYKKNNLVFLDCSISSDIPRELAVAALNEKSFTSSTSKSDLLTQGMSETNDPSWIDKIYNNTKNYWDKLMGKKTRSELFIEELNKCLRFPGCSLSSDFKDIIKFYLIHPGSNNDLNDWWCGCNLWPIKLTLTITGMVGWKYGDIIRIKNLPPKYKNNCYFNIININHSINNSEWVTNIECLYRLYITKPYFNVDFNVRSVESSFNPDSPKNKILSQPIKDGEGIKVGQEHVEWRHEENYVTEGMYGGNIFVEGQKIRNSME